MESVLGILPILIFVGLWVLIQSVILPRLGVGT
jgi:hypothetical protein